MDPLNTWNAYVHANPETLNQGSQYRSEVTENCIDRNQYN